MVIKAAIYARHSSRRQETSSDDQIDRCKRWCEKEGIKVVSVYTDKAISGAFIIDRPEVKELLKDAENRRFDQVICEDLSRMSRNLSEIAYIYDFLNFQKVSLISLVDGEVTKTLVGLRGIINDVYRTDLSDKTRRGLIATVLRGTIPLSKVYGYRKVHKLDERGNPVKGVFEVNEEQAEIIKKIFHLHDTGTSPICICNRLDEDEIPTPRGGASWNYLTLVGKPPRYFGILTQPMYVGRWFYNRTERLKNPVTGKSEYRLRPEEDFIELELPDLKIVDSNLFNRVQKQIKERSQILQGRKVYFDNLPAEEKLKRELAKSRKNHRQRIKSNLERQKRTFIFSKKLECGKHNQKISTVRAGFFSCPDKSCEIRAVPWDKITVKCLAAILSAATDSAFNEAAKACGAKKRKNLKLIDRNTNRIEVISNKVNYLIESFDVKRADKNSPTSDVIRKLEREAQTLHAQTFEIGERNKFPVSTVQEAKKAKSWFLKQIKPLEKNSEQYDLIRILNSCIERIEIVPLDEWREGKIQISVCVSLNIDRIFETFKTDTETDLTASVHFSSQ